MKGVLLAANFSKYCNTAKRHGYDKALKEYSESKGKTGAERDIRKYLKILVSYLYYLVIATANSIKDPFDERVVEAHWIGNELLEKVNPDHAKYVISLAKTEKDKIIRAIYLKPVLEGKGAHHNIYVKEISLHPACRVTIQNAAVYHFGKKIIDATPDIKKSLKQYGKT